MKKESLNTIESRLREQASQMSTTTVLGRLHVIRPFSREANLDQPNYNGTGQAFVGILNEGNTLEQFKKDWVKSRLEIERKHY